MIFLALVCASLIGLLAYVLYREQSKEREWAQERQLLITRLQHPEIVPVVESSQVSPGMTHEETREVLDDIDLVGTVQAFNGDGD